MEKIIYPSYYNDFTCIADKCQHTCCKGWEIEIDNKTLAEYKSNDGTLSKRFKKCIDFDNGCFILDKDERCPFLNQNGLCDIITNLGKEALCQICSDHPRFVNDFPSYCEIGLGLCCESSAKLIIDQAEPFSLVANNDFEMTDEEKDFYEIRNEIFNILTDGSLSLLKRFNNAFFYFFVPLPSFSPDEIVSLLFSLERLDTVWDNYIEKLSSVKNFSLPNTKQIENIACYFVYRYLSKAFWEEDFVNKLALAFLSTLIIGTLADISNNHSDIYEIARLFSSEIEYSDENVDKICEFCQNQYDF